MSVCVIKIYCTDIFNCFFFISLDPPPFTKIKVDCGQILTVYVLEYLESAFAYGM